MIASTISAGALHIKIGCWTVSAQRKQSDVFVLVFYLSCKKIELVF